MTALPQGLTAGVWNIDVTHASANFTVRHAGISKVRGSVPVVEGAITFAETAEDSVVTVSLDANGINTGNEDRDNHLRSADFFNVEQNPTWTFNSTAVEAVSAEEYKITGDLTINGVTKSVVLATEYAGVAVDPFGNNRAGFEATIDISRKEFGLTWNAALEAGGVLVSDTVKIAIDISVVAS